jgi:hypothetical protein
MYQCFFNFWANFLDILATKENRGVNDSKGLCLEQMGPSRHIMSKNYSESAIFRQ